MATGSPYGGFADLSRYQNAVAQPSLNPLESLIQGFQQGAAIQQLPQQLAQQQLQQQLAAQLQQAKLQSIPLEAEKERLLIEQLRSQLDPTYQVRQNAAKIAFDVDRARALGELEKQMATTAPTPLEFTTTGGERIGQNRVTGEVVSRIPIMTDPEKKKTNLVLGFDTKSGTYGNWELGAGESLPQGVVPSTQIIPRTEEGGGIVGGLKGDVALRLKTPSATQVDQITAMGVLESLIDDIEKTPKETRKSNVGWIDNVLGSIQSATDLGAENTIKKNEAFRNAVNALVAEFSFGRGGKALTANETTVLGKYLPKLTQGDTAFDERVKTFKKLVVEMKGERLKALRDSGYDASNLGGDSTQSSTGSTANAPGGKIKIIAPDGKLGFWPSNKPIPEGFRPSQ